MEKTDLNLDFNSNLEFSPYFHHRFVLKANFCRRMSAESSNAIKGLASLLRLASTARFLSEGSTFYTISRRNVTVLRVTSSRVEVYHTLRHYKWITQLSNDAVQCNHTE